MKHKTSGPSRPGEEPDFFSKQVSSARRFCLDLNPPRHCALAVTCGGWEHCTPDYSIHRAPLPFYTLEYVLRGRGHLTLGGRGNALAPGCLFSYGPGIPQDITSDPSDPLVKYFVDFVGTRVKPLLRSCRLGPGRVLQIFPPNEIQGIFDELIRCGIKGARHAPELCAALLKCLALKITDSGALMEGAGVLSFTTFQKCEQHIQEHFLRITNLEQIAADCHVHHVYLCRLFKRYRHQSPYQFLLRLKMNHAAGLLQQPGTTVKDVAERIGFNDPFHLSRAFKSVFGLPPKTFRHVR